MANEDAVRVVPYRVAFTSFVLKQTLRSNEATSTVQAHPLFVPSPHDSVSNIAQGEIE